MRIILENIAPELQAELERSLSEAGWNVSIGTGASVGAQESASGRRIKASTVPEAVVLGTMGSAWQSRLASYQSLNPAPLLLALVSDLSQLAAALQEGAADAVLPPFLPGEVDTRIRARLTHPATLTLGECELDLHAGEAHWPDRSVSLTAIEQRLLLYLWRQAGRAVEREELLRRVWGYQVALDTRAVALTISRLRKKIEAVPEEPHHLLTAYGLGYRLVLMREPRETSSRQAFELPVVRASLVGREPLIEAVEQQLRASGRVLLHGPGGIGKTRLALALGARRQDSQEVVYCDASSQTQVSFLLALARALNVRAQGSVLLSLVDALRGRHLLLLLDNCEHLMEPCLALLNALIGLSDLQVLLTSRIQFANHLAVLIDVPPLSLPQGRELFLQRVRQQAPLWQSSPADLAAIEQLVQRLDGLPLAIELAAVRAPLLSPAQILLRLEQRFTLLSTPHPLSLRHQSLQKTLDDAWEMLSPELQDALRSCAVFQGGFELDAAEAILAPAALPALDRVQLLVRHSLVQLRHGAAQPRCVLFETVRAYLLAMGVTAECVARHRHHYAEVLTQLVHDAMGMEVCSAMRRFEVEHSNLLAAFQSACEVAPTQAVQLAEDMCQLYWMQGDIGALTLLEQLPTDIPIRLVRRVEVQRARALMRLGRTVEARTLLEPLVQNAAEGLEPEYRLHALQFRASMDLELGLVHQALEMQREVVAQVEALGLQRWSMVNLIKLADCYRNAGQLKEARAALQQALRKARTQESQWNEMMALAHLSLIEHLLGELTQAEQTLAPWLEFMQRVGDRHTELQGQLNLAQVCLDAGKLDRVVLALERARVLEQRARNVISRMFYARVRARLAIEQNELLLAEEVLEAGVREYSAHRIRPLAQLLGLLAWVRHLQGQPAKALAALLEAEGLFPSASPPPELGLLWLRRAMLLSELGQMEAGAQLWQQAKNLLHGSEVPAHRAMVQLVAQFLVREGQVSAQAIGVSPLSPAALRQVADEACWTDARWVLRLFEQKTGCMEVAAGADSPESDTTLIQP